MARADRMAAETGVFDIEHPGTGVSVASPKIPPGRLTHERIVRRLLAICERTQDCAGAVLHRYGYRSDVDHFLRHELPAMPEDRLWGFCSSLSVALSNTEGKAAGRAAFRSSDWRVLFYCLLGSRTLEEAIFRLEDLFETVDGRFGTIALRMRAGTAVLGFSGLRSSDRDAAFVVSLHGMAMYHSLLSWAIGQPLGTLAEFDFPESMRQLADHDLLPFELALECEQAALLFCPALLKAPIIRNMSDLDRLPSLNPLLQMARGEARGALSARVRRMLQNLLQRQQVMLSLDECAAILGISPATIRRRLRDDGTSFRELRDDVRRTVATDLLADSTVSVEDVATRLDFCDSDALRLATRKWVGLSPSAYRRFLLQGGCTDALEVELDQFHQISVRISD